MTTRILKGALLGLGLVTLTGPALAQSQDAPAYNDSSMILLAAADERGNGNRGDSRRNDSEREDRDNDNDNDRGNAERVNINFGVEEARRIAVANNLTGYEGLPPGIRKNLARGKPLPPGHAKRMVPASMMGQLPVRQGYEWQMSGTDLMLVETGTLLVVEILEGVFQ